MLIQIWLDFHFVTEGTDLAAVKGDFCSKLELVTESLNMAQLGYKGLILSYAT